MTAENYNDFMDATKPYAPVANQLDATAHPTKNVWLNIYKLLRPHGGYVSSTRRSPSP